MTHITFGIFASRIDAEYAIHDLKDAGYDVKDISIMLKNSDQAEEIATDTGTNVGGGAATGAVTGTLIGGFAGLLIGIGAFTIPGIGPFLIGGPIATSLGLTGAAASTMTGAATGAVAGGLLGVLMSLGVSEDDARIYERRINEGGILVTIPSTLERANEVRVILEENDADEIKSIAIHAEKQRKYANFAG